LNLLITATSGLPRSPERLKITPAWRRCCDWRGGNALDENDGRSHPRCHRFSRTLV